MGARCKIACAKRGKSTTHRSELYPKPQCSFSAESVQDFIHHLYHAKKFVSLTIELDIIFKNNRFIL